MTFGTKIDKTLTMGLPQVSSGSIAEEVAASLSTFVQTPPQIVGVSSCDLRGMHGGNLGNRMQMDLPCSSLGDSQTKTVVENKHGWLTYKSGHNIQAPVPRIVGFESRGLNSPANVFNGNQSVSTVVSINGDAVESNGSLVRKRLLSPLNGMLLPDQFNGDCVDIGDGICKSGFWGAKDNYKFSVSQEHKKAHIGNSDYFNSPNWSLNSLPEWKNSQDENCGANSIFFTDGPVLEAKELKPHNQFMSLPGANYCGETTKIKSHTRAIAIPVKKVVSPPLSLSPLGPKLPERIKSAGVCSNINKQLDDECLTFKDIEQSLDGTVSSILSSRKDEAFTMLKESLHDFDNLHTKFDVFSPDITSGIGHSWGEDSNLTSQYPKSSRTLGGLPVRRSLVGSFEESLLSGRLSSGKVSQVSTLRF